MFIDYSIDLGVDLLAIFVLAYVLYFRRHRRADLLLAYVALNLGIFVAMSLLGQVRVDVAVGFGLFAILSIIRLRSTSVTQQEVAYYFVALVLGLANGLDLANRWLLVSINVLLVTTMFVVDNRWLRGRARRLDFTLDTIHTDEATLVADLQRRLGATVEHHEVNAIDHSRGTMLVDVRYRVGAGDAPAPAPASWIEVSLDVVHNSAAALVADLERRLGGRVLQHRVREIDYVRDVTVVDVRVQAALPVPDPRYGVPTTLLPVGNRPGTPRVARPVSPPAVPRPATAARSAKPVPFPRPSDAEATQKLRPRPAETTQILDPTQAAAPETPEPPASTPEETAEATPSAATTTDEPETAAESA